MLSPREPEEGPVQADAHPAGKGRVGLDRQNLPLKLGLDDLDDISQTKSLRPPGTGRQAPAARRQAACRQPPGRESDIALSMMLDF